MKLKVISNFVGIEFLNSQGSMRAAPFFFIFKKRACVEYFCVLPFLLWKTTFYVALFSHCFFRNLFWIFFLVGFSPQKSKFMSLSGPFSFYSSAFDCVYIHLYPPKGRAERTRWGPLDSLSNLICVWETKMELSKTRARIDLFWNLKNLYPPKGDAKHIQ